MELKVLVMGIIIINIARLVQVTTQNATTPTPTIPTTPTTQTTTTTTPTTQTTTPTTPTTPNPTVEGQKFCMQHLNLTGTNTSIPDSFQYECTDNGTVVINYSQFSGHKSINFKFVEPNTVNADHCIPGDSTSCSASNDAFFITGCDKGMQMYISLDELHQTTKGIGGQHYKLFSIMCPVNFNDTLTHSAFTLGGTPETNTEVKNDLPPNAMKVVKESDDNEVTQAAVGDPLRLMISTSDLDYYIKVLKCSASNAKITAAKTVELWDVTKKPKAVDSEIFDNDWRYKNCSDADNCMDTATGGQSAAIKFYAFRFEDTNVVVFSCGVRFCYKNSTECLETLNHRKKRGTDNTNHVTGRVTQVLVVTDIRSGSQKPTYSMPMMFSILMVVIAKSV